MPRYTDAIAYTKHNEGYRRTPYKDHRGNLTIAYGLNLADPGISREEADMLLRHRMEIFDRQIREKLPWTADLDEVRYAVLLDLAYNLKGNVRGLLKFKKMLAALEKDDYETAAAELLNSQYARDVKTRATRNAKMQRTGVWQI